MATTEEPVEFTVPCVDDAQDLHGTARDPDLVVLMGGNEFMVLPDLLAAFRAAHPAARRAFVETLPPGLLGEQLERGALRVGRLVLDGPPDVFTAGKDRIARLRDAGRAVRAVPYASNALAIMVRAGNPRGVRGLADLARDDVRVALPDAAIEDIGRKAADALRAAGGEALVSRVADEKARAGGTFVTRIHHRQTPARILAGESDAGIVWRTEVLHQRALGNPVEEVAIPGAPRSTSFAAVLRDAPHREAAEAFVSFLASGAGRAAYARHGFDPPDAE